jgi:hypothetical protein
MFARTATITISIAALALSAIPVRAQYMMHLDPNLYMFVAMNMNSGPNTCMNGIAPPDKEIDEARLPAPGIMQAYFAAAQGGSGKAASFRNSKKASWTYGDTVASQAQIDAQTDPLAVAGNRLDTNALRFFRSGDFQTAQGQWLVNRADGEVAGLYDAVFKREKKIWKLERLTIFTAADPVVPAMQYCATPGDVAEHNMKSAANQIDYLEKEIVKAQAKLEKAKETLAADEAALAAKPSRAELKEMVRQSTKQLEARKKKLADLQENLVDAQKYRDNSSRDKAEIAEMTLPAAQAARFSGFETTTAKDLAAKKAEEEAKKKAEKEAKQAAKAG